MMDTIIETSQGIIFAHSINGIFPIKIPSFASGQKNDIYGLRISLYGDDEITLEEEEASMFLKYFFEEYEGEDVVTIKRHPSIQRLLDQPTSESQQ